jgi:hypothetical protein
MYGYCKPVTGWAFFAFPEQEAKKIEVVIRDGSVGPQAGFRNTDSESGEE